MQQSEILLDNSTPDSSQGKSMEALIEKLHDEEDQNKKHEIYRKIEIAIIKGENLNSAGINYRMRNYFSKITEPNEFDKSLMKLMLASGWKVPQDFRELDSLNIKECPNDFFLQDVEIKIQDYKKTYETLPIKIEEYHQKEFFNSLEIAFEYLGYCTNSSDRNEVEYNKKNILRIDVNGIKLGFSAIGLYDFLENIELKKSQEKISFAKFIEKPCGPKKLNFIPDFKSLKEKCIFEKQLTTDENFAKEVLERGMTVRSSIELSRKGSLQNARSSIESSRRGSFQNFSSVRNSFQESSSRRNSFQESGPNLFKTAQNEKKILRLEGDKFVIKDPDPTCFSFLKTMFCNCFGKKNQQQNSGQNQDSRSSSDHSLHPSTSFISSQNASAMLDQRGIVLD
jgi:hypothetical protein